MTFVELTDHGRRVGGGFGGPALYPDESINHWLGRTDNYPSSLLTWQPEPRVTRDEQDGSQSGV